METGLFLLGTFLEIFSFVGFIASSYLKHHAPVAIVSALVVFAIGIVLLIIALVLTKRVVRAQDQAAYKNFLSLEFKKIKNSLRYRDLPDKTVFCRLLYSPRGNERIVCYKKSEDKPLFRVVKQRMVPHNWEQLRMEGSFGFWNIFHDKSYPTIQEAEAAVENLKADFLEDSLPDDLYCRKIVVLRKKTFLGFAQSAPVFIDGIYEKLKNGRGFAVSVDGNLHVVKVSGTISIVSASDQDEILFIRLLPPIRTFANKYDQPWEVRKINPYGEPIPAESSESVFGI